MTEQEFFDEVNAVGTRSVAEGATAAEASAVAATAAAWFAHRRLNAMRSRVRFNRVVSWCVVGWALGKLCELWWSVVVG